VSPGRIATEARARGYPALTILGYGTVAGRARWEAFARVARPLQASEAFRKLWGAEDAASDEPLAIATTGTGTGGRFWPRISIAAPWTERGTLGRRSPSDREIYRHRGRGSLRIAVVVAARASGVSDPLG
jgi:hypothetical protein